MSVNMALRMAAAMASGASDPYWSSVSVLAHGGGTNGGTVFTDSAGLNTLTGVGNAQTSTAQYKFPSIGSSMLFDGTGDYITSGTTNTLYAFAGDFTIECFVYFNSVGGAFTGIAAYADEGGWNGWQFLKTNATLSFQFLTGSAGADTVTNGTTLTTGQWYHVAVVRSSGTSKIYLDGTGGTGVASSASNSSASSKLIIANDRTLGNGLNGYIADLRITKGVARYTANFTPSTTTFPNS